MARLLPLFREAGVLKKDIALDGVSARALAAAAELGFGLEEGLSLSVAQLAFEYGTEKRIVASMAAQLNGSKAVDDDEGSLGLPPLQAVPQPLPLPPVAAVAAVEPLPRVQPLVQSLASASASLTSSVLARAVTLLQPGTAMDDMVSLRFDAHRRPCCVHRPLAGVQH
jgi:hypothetical protein